LRSHSGHDGPGLTTGSAACRPCSLRLRGEPVDNSDVKWWPDWRQIFDLDELCSGLEDPVQASKPAAADFLDSEVAEIPVVRSRPHRKHELLHDVLQPKPICRIIE
jgi:hypothetical protein